MALLTSTSLTSRGMVLTVENVHLWSVDVVSEWIRSFSSIFGDLTESYVQKFKQNHIDGEVLITYLSPNELKSELGIESAGHRRKLIMAIDRLRGGLGEIASEYSISRGQSLMIPNQLGGRSSSISTKHPPLKPQSSDLIQRVKEEKNNQVDLFISYSHSDSEFAMKLKNALVEAGFGCWMDTDLKTGEDWELALEENLTFSKAVVAIISPRYEVSESCRNEVRLSLNRGKRIFPVLYETLKQTDKVPLEDGHWPPHGLGFALARTQYTDFTKNWLIDILSHDLEASGIKKNSKEASFSALWKKVDHSGDIPFKRFGSTMFNFGTQTVLFGGTTYTYPEGVMKIIEYTDVFMLDNQTMKWSQQQTTGTPHPSGYGCSALLCGEGVMICIGGGNYVKSYNDVTILNFNTMIWETPIVEGELPETRYGHTSTLINNKILVFGGRKGSEYFNDVYSLDISKLPNKVTWKKVAIQGTPPSPRYQSSATLVGGRLIIYGGSKIDESVEIDPDVYSLNLHEMKWEKFEIKGKAPLGRRQHSSVLIGRDILTFGGKGLQKSFNEIVVLDTFQMSWKEIKVQGEVNARGLHAAVQRGNQLMIFGGLTDEVVKIFNEGKSNQSIQLRHLDDLQILEFV